MVLILYSVLDADLSFNLNVQILKKVKKIKTFTLVSLDLFHSANKNLKLIETIVKNMQWKDNQEFMLNIGALQL